MAVMEGEKMKRTTRASKKWKREKGGIEGSTRMPDLAYYYARDSVISAAFTLSVYLV